MLKRWGCTIRNTVISKTNYEKTKFQKIDAHTVLIIDNSWELENLPL